MSSECLSSGSEGSTLSDGSSSNLELMVPPDSNEEVLVKVVNFTKLWRDHCCAFSGGIPYTSAISVVDDGGPGEPSQYPRSILKVVDLERFRTIYGIPNSELRLSCPDEKAD